MGATGHTVGELLPGLAALVVVAGTAHALADSFPFVNALVLSVVMGAVVANLVDLPRRLDAGIERHDLLLETGIVLLGASVPLESLLNAGGVVLGLVVTTVAFGLGFAEALSRRVFPLSRHEGSLLAAGASICGVSAVVAVGRGIDADRSTLAYVAGAVLLFDAVTLVAFPAIGGLLGLPDRVFGVWAGLSMFSTGPVAAAGFAVSMEAGRWATITKLARNALIGIVVAGYAVAYARESSSEASSSLAHVRAVWDRFPKFLVGFFAVVLLANTGVVSGQGLAALETASAWLFAIAFAGVGFSIRVREMRAAGLRPLAVLLVYLLVVGGLTLFVVPTVL